MLPQPLVHSRELAAVFVRFASKAAASYLGKGTAQ
jgi:hypothetical protein